MNLRQLQDATAWEHLNGAVSLEPLRSEAYAESGLEKWLLGKAGEGRRSLSVFHKLAVALIRNHGDSWFADFVSAPLSKIGNGLLLSAIEANRRGDVDLAARSALSARQFYLKRGNLPGALRSERERIYSLRRQSRTPSCLKEARDLLQSVNRLPYPWLKTQTLLESASCALMSNRLDSSWRYVRAAVEEARRANYPDLSLRALGFEGGLESREGRDEVAWSTSHEGLKLFWQGSYSNDRAFQFYNNLQVSSDAGPDSYLTFLLHREAVNMIAAGPRVDFTAMARIELAAAAEAIGDYQTEEHELDLARELFATLPSTPSKAIHQAYCEVGLASVAIRRGLRQKASAYLQAARDSLSQIDDLAARLQYLKTQAELDRLSNDSLSEERDLTDLAALANRSFSTLKDAADRWKWAREVQGPYRRLLEIRFSRGHSALSGLAAWQSYRSLESNGLSRSPETVSSKQFEQALGSRISTFKDWTLITFAVLPGSVRAWIADDRGIKEFNLGVEPEALNIEVMRFHRLCADPTSPIEKVNASGSRLYDWLLGPVQRALDSSRGLLIEGDSLLTLIPWAALRMPEGAYLGQTRTITNDAGLRLGPIRRRNRTVLGKVLVATPGSVEIGFSRYLSLPEAEREAAYITGLYPRATWLRSGEATSGRVVDGLTDAEIFHFGGHAIARQFGGELIVEGEQGGDIITASTLGRVRMKHASLVVLAACSTAIGDRDWARDPNGLVQAFLHAGASHVVASRWDVDSHSSAELMTRFYRSLRAGVPASGALQLARQQLISQQDFAHPHFWAAFEIFGQGGN